MAVRTFLQICSLLVWIGGIPHPPFIVCLFLQARGGMCKNGVKNWSEFVELDSINSRFLLRPGTSHSCLWWCRIYLLFVSGCKVIYLVSCILEYLQLGWKYFWSRYGDCSVFILSLAWGRSTCWERFFHVWRSGIGLPWRGYGEIDQLNSSTVTHGHDVPFLDW